MLLHTLPTPIEHDFETYRSLVESSYMSNGSLALVLPGSNPSYNVTISVNLVHETLDAEAGEFFLNVNSETVVHFGRLLSELGVLRVTDQVADSGYVTYPKCVLVRENFLRSEETNGSF